MADPLSTALFFLFLLAGSVSLGYLVLRFVYPEIRTFDKRNKLVTTTVVGVAIALSSLAADYAFNGYQRVLNLDSFSMPIMFAVTCAYFLILRGYFLYASTAREFITVGIPIAAVASFPSEKPAESNRPEITQRIAEVKKKLEARQAADKESGQVEIDKLEKRITEKLQREKIVEVKKLSEERAKLQEQLKAEAKRSQADKTQAQEKFQSELKKIERQIAEKLEKEKTGEVSKLQSEKIALQNKLEQQLMEKADEQRELQAHLAEQVKEVERRIAGKMELEKAEEVKKLSAEKEELQKKLQLELSKKEEERRVEFAKLQNEKAELEKQLAEQRQTVETEKKKTTELKKLEEQKQLVEKGRSEAEKRQAEERKKRLRVSIGESETYLEKIKQRVEALKKKKFKELKKTELPVAAPVQVKVEAIKEAAKVKQLQRETMREPVEVKMKVVPVGIGGAVLPAILPPAAVPVPAAIPVPTGTPAKLQPAKPFAKPSAGGGLLDFIFGGGSSSSTKEQPKQAAKPQGEFATWRSVKEQEEKKAVEKKKSVEQKKAEEAELDALVKTVTKEAEDTSIQGTGPVHRRYLLKDEVKVIASKEVAQKEEFGYMVQDIYSQLHSSQQQATVGDVLKVDAPKQLKPMPQQAQSTKEAAKGSAVQTAAPVVKPEAGVSVSDILGADIFGASPKQSESSASPGQELFASEAAPSAGGDIFSQLQTAAAGGSSQTQVQAQISASVQSAKSDVSFVQMQAEKGVGCPTCHSKTSKIIFCPYCSTGMCANCSPSIKPIGPGQFIYVCPKCGEEVTIKKKAA